MIRSVAEHQQAVAGLLRYSSGYAKVSAETIPVSQAGSRVLAEDIFAPINLPPFDNSQMDGYAVHEKDLNSPTAATAPLRLRIAAPVPAGVEPAALEPGTAAPIMTGAMIPPGAAAVVPIERAEPAQFPPSDPAGGQRTVELPAAIEQGSYIRRTGSDIAAGTTALTAGTLLGTGQLGLLSALGIDTVSVRPRFRVLILSTGDEVQEPGTVLQPGRIYDANATLLDSGLREAGAVVVRHRVMGDNPDLLEAAFGEIDPAQVHLIITTGGISQGAYEVVKQALARSTVEFHSVAMQPGGPQAMGTVGGVPFLGFPGNPVSALVSFEMFLRPALSAIVGAPAPRVELTARLGCAVESTPAKHQVRRGIFRDGTVELVGGPGSHLIHALATSNALVHLPAGLEKADTGDPVTVWLIDAVEPARNALALQADPTHDEELHA